VATTGQRVLSAANSIVERLDTKTSRATQTESPRKIAELPLATVGVAPERLVTMHEAAASWYQSQLLSPLGDGPRSYLEARGLGQIVRPTGREAHDPWQVGYAPDNWTALVDHLGTAGFSDSELEIGGLAIRTRKGNLISLPRPHHVAYPRRPRSGDRLHRESAGRSR
jgi:hypothetical protein